MKLDIPFYPNTPDDTHCFQAVLRMVLKYFLPHEEYTWKELDKMTAKKEGLWTWPMAALLELRRKGFEIASVEVFDYGRFAREGPDYLYEFLGDEVAQAQVEHSDIQQERRLAREFVQEVGVDKRIPSMTDIVTMMNDGYLVTCNVNSHALRNRPGYAGHYVLITGYGDSELVLHDPGLPPLKNRAVSAEVFERAWQYPNKTAKNVTGMRLPL